MEKILINISNHPSHSWEENQKEGWDKILDIPFPSVPPKMTMGEIWKLGTQIVRDICDSLVKEINDEINFYPLYVMIEGEASLTFAIIELLRERRRFVVLVFPIYERKDFPNGNHQLEFSGWRFVGMRGSKVLKSAIITLTDGKLFEVYARCYKNYIGLVDGEIKVLSEYSYDFPYNPHTAEYDNEGNLTAGWVAYCEEVPEIIKEGENFIDPIGGELLVTLRKKEKYWPNEQEWWELIYPITLRRFRFSTLDLALETATEMALWEFYRKNLGF